MTSHHPMKPSTSPRIPLLAAILALAIPACNRTPEPSRSNPSASGGASAATVAPPSRKARAEAAKNTRDILAAISPECLACADKGGCFDPAQQGGVCETMTGMARSGATEAAVCLKTLQCVVGSRCSDVGHETPCLCGSTDIGMCIAGQAPPTGPCVPVFAEDFGNDGKAMYDQFINQKFGAGRANAIIQCAVQTCDRCKGR